ncbi:SIMPL domain-containing protein [Riemerella anatipestifer]|nr:SIMPL domain-containing protein [Riemerella anatipestifer]MDY3533997.1 SIMPL domain-containing protein [Riemerella anatipestifer]MDY3536211.1 SIMPL domain-containing protein [Riemerella anatipestifer]
MKHLFLILMLFCGQFIFGQKNFLDQPYLETSGKADTLVIPDKITININLNEADTKNKISVEEQEKRMESALKKLGINTEKDLSLNGLSSGFKTYFLKGQNIIKQKNYSLIVRNAVTAGKVLMALEEQGISNVNISKLEYTKEEELLLALKSKAILKSRLTAERMVKTLNQKLGKAIFISDENNAYPQVAPMMMRSAKAVESYDASSEAPIDIEFNKIKYETFVNVKFQLD